MSSKQCFVIAFILFVFGVCPVSGVLARAYYVDAHPPKETYNPHYMDGGVMVSYDLNTGVTLTLIDGVMIDATIPGHMDR